MFVPLSPKRNFEEVANQIKELILSGQLKPLERLPSERDMAEQFNASRNTVREAYRILEETGFIRMKTGNTGGAMVCTPDGRRITQSLSDLAQMGSISLQEITQSRLTLELAALEESFPHFDEHRIIELETCLQKAEELVNEPDNGAVGSRRSDLYNFHVKLAEASHNRVYVYLVKSLVRCIEYVFKYLCAPDYHRNRPYQGTPQNS